MASIGQRRRMGIIPRGYAPIATVALFFGGRVMAWRRRRYKIVTPACLWLQSY